LATTSGEKSLVPLGKDGFCATFSEYFREIQIS